MNWLHPQCEAAITPQVTLCLLSSPSCSPPSFWHPFPVSCRLFGQGLVSECDYGRWYKQRRVMDLAFSRR
ncbi:Cholesterol 24-hydroxylase [Cricetulus griseus]|uniref:Cholesterol 24-hydroxylase n=1 Tax=Cricetulus griseus TaxID=10029 RepID=G3HIW6_CRIGR|nr:Cholesterol 24-hydroxylase [Cricetulus griseus]